MKSVIIFITWCSYYIATIFCAVGMDYDNTQDMVPLSFLAGDGVGDVRCVNYTIINDNISEPDEIFIVSLGTDDVDRLMIESSRGEVRIRIIDDDGKCSLLKHGYDGMQLLITSRM